MSARGFDKQIESVAIVGAGITGLTTASMIKLAAPQADIIVYDAGSEPTIVPGDTGYSPDRGGATLGAGRDARHYTGTEGLSFQNEDYIRLLNVGAEEGGWRTLPEDQLTANEHAWRAEGSDKFKRNVTARYNPVDSLYAQINYAGMAAWRSWAALDPRIIEHRISPAEDSGIYVAFGSDAELKADFDREQAFYPGRAGQEVRTEPRQVISPDNPQALANEATTNRVLRVPGTAWRIKSLWNYMYKTLSADGAVQFHWDTPVEDLDTIEAADSVVWATGSASGYETPDDIYSKPGRVQGLGGWWITLANPGIDVPFKYSAPQPTGYLNITPAGESLHLSGGFGWTGERDYQTAVDLLEPLKTRFAASVGRLLGISSNELLKKYEFGPCIRPATPTGLPDIHTHEAADTRHIILAGAGKAGATQAPLLALHAIQEIFGTAAFKLLTDETAADKKLINQGLGQLQKIQDFCR
jgi:glycine/D-amino acid oxidase-like deaminating enzyme